jgi:type VI secretion system protein ImpH
MATASRPADHHVAEAPIEQQLRQRPWTFQFFQAVRLLQLMRSGRQTVGGFGRPEDETVRFSTASALGFPASQIQGIDWSDEDLPRLIVNFLGLTGPSGVLPYCYTELLLERARAKDQTLQAFLDVFHHRLISLFYSAWEKYRFWVTYERGEADRFSHYLLDLIGLGTPKLQDRQAVADQAMLYYAGLFSQQPRSAAALGQILEDYFDVPVEIEQFAGSWYRLDRDAQCTLGESEGYSEQVGVGVVVGDAVWDQQSRARIRLGPLTLAQYRDFLPDGTAFEPLCALTRFFSNDQFDFEVQLILRRDQVPSLGLAPGDVPAPQLGWVSWITTRPVDRDPDETILRL